MVPRNRDLKVSQIIGFKNYSYVGTIEKQKTNKREKTEQGVS
jgi:hypothetical protein